MIKRRWIGALTALLMGAAVLLTAAVWLFPSAFANFARTVEPAYVSAMDKNAVMDIQIICDEDDWAQMLENATAKEYIPVTIVINGKKIKNAGIRPKGNSSLSMVAQDDTSDRYSFKIEFDHYIKGQNWLGLDKMVINNMHGDATYLKEYLSYDLMEYIGVDVPRYAFSNIKVNGEEWGFYIAIEALEDGYAQRVYGNGHGKLYKPETMNMGGRGDGQMNEFVQQIEDIGGFHSQRENQALGRGEAQGGISGNFGNFDNFGNFGNMGNFESAGAPGSFGGGQSGGASLEYSGDEISSYSAIFNNAVFDSSESDFKRVISALEKLSTGEDIESAVDVEATLRYFAAHTVIVNMDSYLSSMCHNYYLYEKDGQLTMLPWDFNLAFGGFQASGASDVVNLPIDTPVSGVSLQERPILGKLLEVPQYLELYHGYLQEIVDGYFGGLFEDKIDYLKAMISPYVENDPSAFYDFDSFQKAVGELKNLGLLRAQSIQGQLDGSIPSTSDGQAANPESLIDASGVNLSALGSMSGGNFGANAKMPGRDGTGDKADFFSGQNIDMEKMQKAMEIIQSAGEELTEEQFESLKKLGISDEEIEMIISALSSEFVGPEGLGRRGEFSEFSELPGEGQTREMPAERFTQEQGSRGSSGPAEVLQSAFGQTAWTLIGCMLALLAGLLFVKFYKRKGV